MTGLGEGRRDCLSNFEDPSGMLRGILRFVLPQDQTVVVEQRSWSQTQAAFIALFVKRDAPGEILPSRYRQYPVGSPGRSAKRLEILRRAVNAPLRRRCDQAVPRVVLRLRQKMCRDRRS